MATSLETSAAGHVKPNSKESDYTTIDKVSHGAIRTHPLTGIRVRAVTTVTAVTAVTTRTAIRVTTCWRPQVLGGKKAHMVTSPTLLKGTSKTTNRRRYTNITQTRHQRRQIEDIIYICQASIIIYDICSATPYSS